MSARSGTPETGEESSGLYERLIGEGWGALHPTVREAHSLGRRFVVTGSGSVAHGRTLAARLLARVLSLPAESPCAPVELVVERRGDDVETWDRKLAGKRLRTRQRAGPDRFLVETFRILEFHFRLTVADAGIRFSQRRCALRLGRFSVPLPSWSSPRVEAYERARDARGDASFRVDVNVVVPLAGLVLAYEGELEIDRERTWK